MALVGSDLDRKIKEAAAKNEPQWVGAGDSEMLRVWRIEQFIVKPWPNRNYGQVRTWVVRCFVLQNWAHFVNTQTQAQQKSYSYILYFYQFHTGDSYVVLNTYKPDPNKPKLAHDIHIWIGELIL